ncbi:N-acetylmuramic acid 6-phosphate etherase [Pelagibacterium halotolerans]|uniref:N-acetylmuramic acid 6-phosphate etherase n=1 Tax=Pelagibacterium halotolerans (strain DSM 22347 / JCM 15775 / CGMCC 1.7692 / B2) TaxID=1082931 RepID=G4RDY3_PELHB|nr:N-acetylmuramic acid 6-phosphate etherase [Pelagibacterium halotolerans]AEQ53895.1 N-acetylmuramic acid 6-phosphate etherase [Pelagibacterium halotolerans B2]QJR19961.1 N-acetylmuramic acid 6-phosphate etherase [Pelagibacterium halotolerans]SEA46023.1 N-acetylmuramic acid 6-phosphate etherase [Pelagibacterium halotolerans]
MSALVPTEHADPLYAGLDGWDDAAILSALLDGQKRGLNAVTAAIPDIAKAAELGVQALKAGGRLIYVGAGSPGLIALTDALEIPQTYGIARDRIVIVMAGGLAMTQELLGGPEDDAAQGGADVGALDIGPKDCAICISASGTTRYTVAALRAAKRAGAKTVGIAGNGGAPLLADADVSILLASGAEVISGSTRMAAGTAQKAALNMLSTLIGVRMGHVHDNFMVNVTADNDKLVLRATGIVARIAGVGPDVAAKAMQTAHNEVKPAILLAAGAKDLSEAQQVLAQSGGVVRKALALLGRP